MKDACACERERTRWKFELPKLGEEQKSGGGERKESEARKGEVLWHSGVGKQELEIKWQNQDSSVK